MVAASLELPDELERRIAELVAGTGQTAHAFVLEAIEQAIERAVLRARFASEALEAETQRTGKAYDASEAFDYLAAKARGEKVNRPRARA